MALAPLILTTIPLPRLAGSVELDALHAPTSIRHYTSLALSKITKLTKSMKSATSHVTPLSIMSPTPCSVPPVLSAAYLATKQMELSL